jgi:hypothetical protein
MIIKACTHQKFFYVYFYFFVIFLIDLGKFKFLPVGKYPAPPFQAPRAPPGGRAPQFENHCSRAWNDSVISEYWIEGYMEGSGRNLLWGTILNFNERTGESHEYLTRESRSPSRELNPGPPKFEVMLSTRQLLGLDF